MAITDTQKARLNGMCRGAADATLGTVIQTAENNITTLQGLAVKGGTYTVVAADQTAGSKAIATGLGKNITGFIVQIYRSNALVCGATVTKSAANLTVATNGSTYVVTTNDVINYIVW